ncbi:MAG: hypothetical protein KDC80_07290, partial [Saprospiraceae bacterium]|nr:hypothetical protein [Saprospiraceae bacterium]
MKKTNVTSIQPLSWITSGVRQCMQWMLAGLMLLFATASVTAQTASPNCTDVNASLQANGFISVAISEFVTNCATSGPVDYVVYNQFGGVVQTGTAAPCATVISFYACGAIGREYKVNFSNGLGTCWSNLTFKQSNGPIVGDTTKYLYCLEEEVADWGLYLDRFYGNNNDVYEPSI